MGGEGCTPFHLLVVIYDGGVYIMPSRTSALAVEHKGSSNDPLQGGWVDTRASRSHSAAASHVRGGRGFVCVIEGRAFRFLLSTPHNKTFLECCII